jgi:hypothetical protein
MTFFCCTNNVESMPPTMYVRLYYSSDIASSRNNIEHRAWHQAWSIERETSSIKYQCIIDRVSVIAMPTPTPPHSHPTPQGGGTPTPKGWGGERPRSPATQPGTQPAHTNPTKHPPPHPAHAENLWPRIVSLEMGVGGGWPSKSFAVLGVCVNGFAKNLCMWLWWAERAGLGWLV